ncbi:MAG: TIGR04438 family Trp-rich protein [Burkholderiaceae bacterium]|nr:TIGR04438 family Trp-rich protein [Burkholderiaceae bacterium]
MYLVVLGVALLVLKLAEFGPVGEWSYWAVLWPFAGAVAWWGFADSTGWTKRREMDKMEERKRLRRQTNLESLGMDEKGRRQRR